MLSKLVSQGASQTWLHIAPRVFGSSASPPSSCSCSVLESHGGSSVFSEPGVAVGFLDPSVRDLPQSPQQTHLCFFFPT